MESLQRMKILFVTLVLLLTAAVYVYSEVMESVDLSRWFNNDGIASADNMAQGNFDGGGSTFPAEEVLASGSVLTVQGIMIKFADNKSKPENNIVCKGQTLAFPAVSADKLYFIGSSHGGNYEENFNVVYSDGTEELIKIGFSDWCVQPQYNEVRVVRTGYRYTGKEKQNISCSIWMQEVPLTHPDKKISRLVLPARDNMHIFAITYSLGMKNMDNASSEKSVTVNDSGIIEIKGLFNNQAIASKDDKSSGDFDGSKYYFPAEGLTSGLITVKNIPFKFYSTGKEKDNIKCQQQKLIFINKVQGSFLHILGSAVYGNQQARLKIIYADGKSQSVDLGLTDWCSSTPAFKEEKALETEYRCSPNGVENIKIVIWLVSLPIEKKEIKAVILPDNEYMHVFAMTVK